MITHRRRDGCRQNLEVAFQGAQDSWMGNSIHDPDGDFELGDLHDRARHQVFTGVSLNLSSTALDLFSGHC